MTFYFSEALNMGVKNLWGTLSSSGEAITIGSLGCAIQNSSKAESSDNKDIENLCCELSSVEISNAGHSFAGKALAVDLSCWVCDSQANTNMHSVTKPHLRYVFAVTMKICLILTIIYL